MLKLHYMPGRAAMAPHAALAEARADHTLVEVEEDESGRRPSAYYALNHWGQVPTLEDGDFVLTESSAIMLHLADRFPDAGLGAPAGTVARSELRRHLEWIESELATRPWIAGEERSGADIYLFMITCWGRYHEPTAWEPPNIRAHFDRLLALPGVRRMMAEEGLD
jgi:glutathione S-transferase